MSPRDAWRAWYRFLTRIPAWLGILISSAIGTTVLSIFFFVRTAGAPGWGVVWIWLAGFLIVDVAMTVMWSGRGYSLTAPPIDSEGNRILRDDVRGR